MPRPTRAREPKSLSPAPLGDDARDAVFRHLASQAKRFPELELAGPETSDLEPRDAALAHAISDSVVRRWLTLEWIVSRFLRGPFAELEPPLRGALLAGSAQLLLLDRIPPHAAINHAVEWAKQRIRPGAGAMVNAVLRKVAALLAPPTAGRDGEFPARPRRERWTDKRNEIPLPDGSALQLMQAILPENQADRLAVVTSTPRALLDAWARSMSAEHVRDLALHGLADPPIILNTAHIRQPLPASGLRRHSLPGCHVFTGSIAELAGLISSRSDLWVQDPASALAVAAAADLRPNLILDLCAGQGTKTRQLEATFPDARVLATDTDGRRLATLAGVFKGSPRVSVLPMPELRRTVLEGRRADLILLDVPCSNTGVLARRPEARYRFDQHHLDSIVGVQRQIIADSIPLLNRDKGRAGGRILYSTCSLQPEENQAQAAWAVRWHGFTTAREHTRLPAGGPGSPQTDYTDGSFAVLLS